jgi:hypothetical protein
MKEEEENEEGMRFYRLLIYGWTVLRSGDSGC